MIFLFGISHDYLRLSLTNLNLKVYSLLGLALPETSNKLNK